MFFVHVFHKINSINFRALLIHRRIVRHNAIAVMSLSKSSNNIKPKRVRWYFKLHLRSEPHEHVFYGEPTAHATAPYLISKSKSQDIELDPFQDVDEEAGWWFYAATSSANLNYRLQSTAEQGHRRANTPRNFPVKGKLSLSLYYEIEARSANGKLEENKIKKSESESDSANDEKDEKSDEENSKESESEIIGNAAEIVSKSDKKKSKDDTEEILDTKDMFTAYQLPLEDYSIVLDPDLAETASPPKSKKRPSRTCQVEYTRQKKGLCGVFHADFQRSEGKTDHCVALFDNDTIVAVRLFVPMAYLPEEFKKEHEEELVKKQTRKIKFLEEDKLVEVHFINNKLAPAYHMSQDGIVDDKVQEVIEPERMTVPELKELLKERNLPFEGVKKELVKRLAAALNIGTCFKTEEGSKSEESNGKKGSKTKAAKSSKKKVKAIEQLDAIAEEEDEEQKEAESTENDVEKEGESEPMEVEVTEESKPKAKPKAKGKKKKAPKKKKGKATKKVEETEEVVVEEGDKSESPESQEDIMGSPIFPSALDDDNTTTVTEPVKQEESSATEAKIDLAESPTVRQKKSPATKKGKSPKKSPAKTKKVTSDTMEASPETESDSGASGSQQSSSQGSNGEKSSASPEEKISTPKRTPSKKGRGKKSPSKAKVADDSEKNTDNMEVEEKNEQVNNIDSNASQSGDKNSSQEIASSSPTKKGQKRKREETESTTETNKSTVDDSNKPIESNGSEEQEPHPKRRRLSRSKDEVLQSTPPQSLTQSL